MCVLVLEKAGREIQAVFDVSPYFPKEIRFESEIEPTFEKRLYAPLQEFIFRVSGRMRTIQAGSIHTYLAKLFVTLVLLLLFGVRIRPTPSPPPTSRQCASTCFLPASPLRPAPSHP